MTYYGKARCINAKAGVFGGQALKTFSTSANTKKCYGKTMFINAGMLAEMLESSETVKDN